MPTLDTYGYKMGTEQELLDYILTRPDIEEIRGNPQRVLDAIDKYEEKTPLMTVGKYKGKLIMQEIEKLEPTLMIELGCYVGYLAIMFGDALARINSTIDDTGCALSKYYSFEINVEYAAIATQLIALAGLSDCVEVIVGKAGSTLPEFEERIMDYFKKYTAVDLVFLDHWKDMYVPDLRVMESLGLVAPGTVIFADNIFYPGAPDYVDYVQGSPELRNALNSTVVNASNPVYPGRWNILYDSTTCPVTDPVTGKKDAVEVTRCVSYLSG